jgi:DNA-3-methyladenine glycosylase II
VQDEDMSADAFDQRVDTAQITIRGPYDLSEVALMGFGHRDERSFDGVMRLAFCVDGDYERQTGVEVRQHGQELELLMRLPPGAEPLSRQEIEVVSRQVSRVLSVDHDGEAFARLCAADPVLARLHAIAPGFRPALFYSPYEAAVWSIISARRARSQGIGLRTRLGQQFGATFDLAGVPTVALPTPSRLLSIDSVPGLPADRIPRLHAVAEAAQHDRLSASRLAAMDEADALQELQRLPGIGPFYSALILVRACGVVDVLSMGERTSREAVTQLYGLPAKLSDAEYAAFAERWKPFRTWAVVLIRAQAPRLEET